MLYDYMIQKGLENVLFQAFSHIQENGLEPYQTITLTFDPSYDDVVVSQKLKEKYKHKMSVALEADNIQGLVVENQYISLPLHFAHGMEMVKVPFHRVYIYVDSLYEFALELNPKLKEIFLENKSADGIVKEGEEKEKNEENQEEKKENNVIQMDIFRKK